MRLRARKILGLAVEEHSVLAAELRISGSRREVKGAAEFVFPEGISLQDPTRLGKALREFLRENHLAARRAVLGIPAKWLLVREKTIPPAGAEAAAGILRMQAERDFSSDLSDLAVDCVDEGDPGQSRPVLLVATLQQKVDQVVAMAQTAGLNVQSVTSSVMALVSATAQSESAGRLALYLRPNSTELAVQAGKQFPLVRHLPVANSAQSATDSGTADSWGAGLTNELRRVVSLISGAQASPEPAELLIWDGVGVDRSVLDALGESLSLEVKVQESLSALGVTRSVSARGAEGCRFAAPVALGLAGFQPGLLPIDFLHSRLTLRKKRPLARRALWATGVTAALVVACLFLISDWQKNRQEVAELNNRLEGMKGDIEAARGIIEKVSLARGWYDRKPRFLDCLRELTAAFPTEGRIWATSLAVQEDMRGTVSGKSVDERTVLEVLDTLNGCGTFSDVKLFYMRQAGTRSREISFVISFTFLGTE